MTRSHSYVAHRSEQGFTLLELLLVVGVSALMLIGIAKITESWVNTEIDTSAGQYTQRVATIVDNFVTSNWSLPLADTDDVIATAAADPNWANLKTALDQEGLMPGGKLRNPLGSDMKIAFKTDTTDPANPIYRAVVYNVTPLPNYKVNEAARQAGNYGGSVNSFNGITQAVGAFGQYNLPLTNLSGAFACTANTTNACLVAVVAYNGSTLNGSFLYRNAVPGHAELNTMTTDLLMNGNSVTGAAAVNAANLNASGATSLGNTNVSGTATFNGPTTAAGGMTVNNGMAVSGDTGFSGNVAMNNGTLNIDSLNSNTLKSPSITTNNFNTQNAAINNGALTVNDDVNVNGNIAATGEVYANTVNAGAVNANGGDMVVGTMNVANTMEIDGNVSVTGGSIVTDRMVSDHCTKIYDPANPNAVAGYVNYGVCP